MTHEFLPIGVARTPYTDWAPHQPPEREPKESRSFRVVLEDEHARGLAELERFSHMIVLSHLDQVEGAPSYTVSPPWAKGREVGLFASRSPRRPNPIGLSVVRIISIDDATIFTSPLDLLDGTPILDLKPYIATLDGREGANDGWIEDFDDHKHLLEHVRGVPHDH